MARRHPPACIHTPKRAYQLTAGQPASTTKTTVASAIRAVAPRTRVAAAGPVAGAARFTLERVARLLAKRAAALVDPRLAEARPLLAELFACELPYCTADGRPTLTEFGLRELERRFGIGQRASG